MIHNRLSQIGEYMLIFNEIGAMAMQRDRLELWVPLCYCSPSCMKRLHVTWQVTWHPAAEPTLDLVIDGMTLPVAAPNKIHDQVA